MTPDQALAAAIGGVVVHVVAAVATHAMARPRVRAVVLLVLSIVMGVGQTGVLDGLHLAAWQSDAVHALLVYAASVVASSSHAVGALGLERRLAPTVGVGRPKGTASAGVRRAPAAVPPAPSPAMNASRPPVTIEWSAPLPGASGAQTVQQFNVPAAPADPGSVPPGWPRL